MNFVKQIIINFIKLCGLSILAMLIVLIILFPYEIALILAHYGIDVPCIVVFIDQIIWWAFLGAILITLFEKDRNKL